MIDPAQQLELTNQIARGLVAGLPDGWRRAVASYAATSTYAELDATVTDDRGERQLEPLPGELIEPFEQLRDQMYTPGKGTWLTMTVTVTAGGRFDSEFNYDDEPAFAEPVPDRTWADELEDYPREPAATPDWMLAKAERAG